MKQKDLSSKEAKKRKAKDDKIGAFLGKEKAKKKSKLDKKHAAGSIGALLAQEAWLKQRGKLEKAIEKLERKVAKSHDPALQSKLEQLEKQLNRMKDDELSVAIKAVPSKPTFSLKTTPSSGICKTKFDADEALRRAERNSRFKELEEKASKPTVTLQEVRMALGSSAVMMNSEDSFSLPAMAYGTSKALEKPYLRLTCAPPLDAVRPPAVLEEALALAKRKWRKGARSLPSANAAYAAFCEQLKSIRQDLTVQHIRSELTVSVYETHARVAMERGDMAEYTQCASCLRGLYHDGLGRKGGNEPEFVAYRLLAALVQGFQEVSLELLSLEQRPELSEHRHVRHALEVIRAVTFSNSYRFFTLYADAPRMSAYLMDALLGKVRADGLSALTAAYGKDLDLAFVCEQLGFDPDTEMAALVEYATQHGAVVDVQRGYLDPKASKAVLAGPKSPKT